MPPNEPYWKRIPRLRAAAGLSQAELFRRTEGVGFDTIRALERPYEDQRDGRRSRARYPSAETLEQIAHALGVDPSEFAEYRLAMARRLLDDRQVGLDEAVENLERMIRALDAFVAGMASADPQKAQLRPLRQAIDGVDPSPREAS